ncbi:hypothetical protein [Barnesiella intestinihominis]|uniref:hypothetical protein n=1 Tax=Barnesiella intestinihominis TaxID=487174 RepID=UPI003AB6E166
MRAEANGNSVSDLTMPNRNPIFVLTKIVKGESRGKRKSRFRFDYAEPQPIFVLTKIAKGECRGKRKSRFRFDYTELQSYLRMYKDSERGV